MNKQDLIDKVASETGESKATVAKLLDTTLDAIMSGVSKREEVQLVGFGTFRPDKRAPRKARNPRDGTPINVPGKVVPKFIAGSRFKNTVAATKVAAARKRREAK